MSPKKLLSIFLVTALAPSFFLPKNGEAVSVSDDLLSAIALHNEGKSTPLIHYYKGLLYDSNPQNYLNLAVIYKDVQRYDLAINILTKAKERFPDDVQVLKLLGHLYYLNAQPDEAIAIFTQILKTDSTDFETNLHLGLCYVQKNDDQNAKDFLEKAALAKKDDILANLSLADLYYRIEKLPEAASAYQHVSKLDGSIQSVYAYLAEIFSRLGNLKEALGAYQKLLRINKENIFAKRRVGELQAQLGLEHATEIKTDRLTEKKNKRVFVVPALPVKDVSLVKIGIIQSENTVEFKCSGPFNFLSKKDAFAPIPGEEDVIYVISTSESGHSVKISGGALNISLHGPVILKPERPESTLTFFDVVFGKNNFWSNKEDRSYRGTVEINSAKNSLTVVNVITLEEYLYSVLPSEMPADWPLEALKAQALAARSEAMKKIGRHKNEGFDFCPEVHCQAYAGVERETEVTSRAVNETQGMIMLYRGKPVDAVYSSNCGGHTQENIFYNKSDIPYFKAVPDMPEEHEADFPLSAFSLELWLKNPPDQIFCNIAPYSKSSNFRWVRIYSANEMNALLNKIADVGPIQKVIVKKREKSGHISAIKIIGGHASYVLEGELKIRKAFGDLRSSMFKVEIKYSKEKTPQSFIFYGGGWGHGVGLCQNGACGMATSGKNFKEILQHYFNGVEFKKVY